MELSIYEIVVIFSYFISACISLFYKYKISDISKPISPKNKKLITFILLFLVYFPFIVCILHIFYRDLGIQYTNYIIFNTFIVLLLTPLIIFKDDVLSFRLFTPGYGIDDLIDTRGYDKDGNRINLNVDDIKSDIDKQKDIDEQKGILTENETDIENNRKYHIMGVSVIIYFSILLLCFIIREVYIYKGITDNFFFKDIKKKFGIITFILFVIIGGLYFVPSLLLYSDEERDELKNNMNQRIEDLEGTETEKQRRSNSSIRLRAAMSEYFNRRDMDQGIYD
jgi:hypothetical protein